MILQGSVKVLVKVLTSTSPNPLPLPEEPKDPKDPKDLPPPLRSKTKSRRNFEDPPPINKLQLRHCNTSISSVLRKSEISAISPISAIISHNFSNPQQKTLEPIDDTEEKPVDSLIEVNTLCVGASFGELALLSHKPRAATIICKENCEFAVLEKEDFLKILKISEEKKLFEEMAFFAKLNIFKGFWFFWFFLLFFAFFAVF